MKKIMTTSLFILVAIALLGLSDATAAEELWVIKDGVLNKEALTPGATEVAKDHVGCGGQTVDGFHVSTAQAGGRANYARFTTGKSALGDCEFRVVFSCAAGRPGWRFPSITISNRGSFCFWKTGSPVLLSNRKTALPLKPFSAPTDKNPFDGNLHSMAVKRVGDKLSFYYDDKKLNEQPIDPDANLHLWFDALQTTIKIKSMKLTAEKFSDKLTTDFKRAAPIEVIFEGSGRPSQEPGMALRYRIPALLVTKKGTVLAFAEARRDAGSDNCDIDIVLRRSSDNGKTWGPEIKVLDQGRCTSGNPCPVVLESGRILLLTCWNAHGAGEAGRRVFVTHSDDDGKTWSKPREITKQAKKPEWHWYATGPGAGAIQLARGEHKGRVIVPCDSSIGRSYFSHIIYSDDNGENWKIGAVSPGGLNECQAVELANGDVMINSRNHGVQLNNRGVCVSHDGGETFDPKLFRRDKTLVEPQCQASLRRYSWPKDDEPGLILYSGPAVSNSRAQGTLRGSYDDGKTWPWKLLYYQGPSGYSDIAVLPDGRVAVLFEKDGKDKLGFTILPPPPAAPPAK
ncbi:MAG: sialidase family protein [Planctomycetota bacterium]